MHNFRNMALAALLGTMVAGCQGEAEETAASEAEAGSIWDVSNLVAWSVGPYDSVDRTPEERAQMLQDLGIERYAIYWIPAEVSKWRDQIQAAKDHGITLQGWWTPFAPDDPQLDEMLALFGEMEVQPDLWFFPPIPTYQEISDLTDGEFPANFDELPMEVRVTHYPILSATLKQIEADNWPKTPEEHQARVESEAARIAAIAAKAEPYGITVDLYSHVQWLGVPQNQAEVVELLRSQGVENVGIVYNFNHARGPDRDDTANFEEVWARIQPYVRTVNIAGTHMEDGTALLPGEGDSELAMMRVIEESGYTGPVGVNAETGGDARETLTNAIAGMQSLAEQLREGE